MANRKLDRISRAREQDQTKITNAWDWQLLAAGDTQGDLHQTGLNVEGYDNQPNKQEKQGFQELRRRTGNSARLISKQAKRDFLARMLEIHNKKENANSPAIHVQRGGPEGIYL